MDGVKLYPLQNTKYYVCLVVVINKNTPPWLSMNNENIMLALIVPSRIKVMIMNVYLQPLINEFEKLLEGIHVYDVSRPIPMERYFMLYGICLYTTHDYPILGFFFGKDVD
jgi:hypothetical protein